MKVSTPSRPKVATDIRGGESVVPARHRGILVERRTSASDLRALSLLLLVRCPTLAGGVGRQAWLRDYEFTTSPSGNCRVAANREGQIPSTSSRRSSENSSSSLLNGQFDLRPLFLFQDLKFFSTVAP